MNESITTNITLPKDLHEKAREMAFKDRISLAELIRQGIALRLKKK